MRATSECPPNLYASHGIIHLDPKARRKTNDYFSLDCACAVRSPVAFEYGSGKSLVYLIMFSLTFIYIHSDRHTHSRLTENCPQLFSLCGPSG